jgi:hypothetical protein
VYAGHTSALGMYSCSIRQWPRKKQKATPVDVAFILAGKKLPLC